MESHEESAHDDPLPQELEPPVETQISPEVTNPGEVPTSTKSKFKKLIQLSKEEKQQIIEELRNGIDNEFYKLRGKGLAYKDSAKRKKRTKQESLFNSTETAINKAEVPPPTEDPEPSPSVSEVDAVESHVRPPPIRKRTLNLIREAQRNDLIEKGFVGGSEAPTYGTRRKKLNLNELSGPQILEEEQRSFQIIFGIQ
jgi:hypothetical protein